MIPDTIQIKKSDLLTHSKLGIASCVLPVIVFIYFFAGGYLMNYALKNLITYENALQPLFTELLWGIIHLGVCSMGIGIGLIFSCAGLIAKDKKRLFPVIGLILNLLLVLLALLFVVILMISAKQ